MATPTVRLRPPGARLPHNPHEVTDEIVAAHFPDDKPIAFMFGLPMNGREAFAWNALEANVATDLHKGVLQAWVVKMALVHGSWVADQFVHSPIWDVSPA